MTDTVNKQLTAAKRPASQTTGQVTGNGSDLWKWLLLGVVIAIGLVGNYLLIEQSLWYQTALWLGVLGVGAGLVLITTPGSHLIQFFKDARLEIRKVVWPTRPETIQATLMVLVAVFLMSILLWVIDLVLFRIINFLTT
ncbi:MAG: preprotein translocase subunit SecE [Gammaproteobacteria bacterium]